MSIFANNSPAQYDLHLHTVWSYDANAEVRPYFERARELGLRCIAITEHHNIDSAEEVLAVASDFPDIRWIPSAELSVTTSIGAVDLLCYNLPIKPEGTLAEVLEEYHIWQRTMGDLISEGMQMIGFDFNSQERLKFLSTFRPSRVLARQGATHLLPSKLKQAALSLGYIQDPEEFTEMNLRRSQVTSRIPYPAVDRVVSAVKEAGGLVVIAHPKGYFNEIDYYRMDQLREECSLDGIECAHRNVDPELTPLYREYCVRNGLISTGGSDSHNPEDVTTPVEKWGHTRERLFACHLGEPEWLDEFLERIG